MKKGVLLDLGAATAKVMDVVALEGNQVAGASEVDAPVRVPVARGAVVRDTVEIAVGYGHAVAGVVSEDEVLAANTRRLRKASVYSWLCGVQLGRERTDCNVINPDHIRVVEGDCIASPHVLGVEIGDGDVSESR